MKQPESLDLLWNEGDLCERLGLPIGGKGRSRIVSYWIQGGLKYVEISSRRFFWEHDIIDFLLKRQSRQEGQREKVPDIS